MVNLSTGHTRLIINVCAANGLLRNQAAYNLSTTYHETGGTMQPVRETFATSDKQAISRLDAAWAKGQLTWVSKPYWRTGFFGRGFVQLTHEDNYEKAAKKLGIDLVGNPTKVMVPEIAAKILVIGSRDGWFTGKKLSDFITLSKSDFFDARAIINGDKNKKSKGQKVTNGELIAGYARDFDALLKAEGYGETAPAKPEPKPVEPITIPAPAPTQIPVSSKSGLASILSLIANLFKRSK